MSKVHAEMRALPAIDADRCVHGRLATASCRRCVDACPHGALVLGEASLGLDQGACTGCGLCRPACPETAITLEGTSFDPVIDAGRTSALAACRRAGVEAASGVLPCLHALGDRDLARLAAARVDTLVTAAGDCATCPDRPGATLDRALARHNRMAAVHGRKTIEHKALTGAAWSSLRGRIAPGTDIDHGRRALFGLLLRHQSERDLPVAGNPGSRTGRDGLFRHVPRIDEARCSGCDACVRVCAHGALVLDPGNGAPAYRVDPARCTGCHLCADECAERAVTVVEMATCDRREIRLDERRCTRCGAPFHLPAAQTADFGLCPICRKTDHHRKLFQVRP